jgi:glutamine synthetase
LLRISSASAGNDNRLGSNEAPPAIVSMFLGDELTEVLEAIENDKEYEDKEKIKMEIGATVLPDFPKDSTDRNRTSPFAFTGNKFEFRMVGSAFSIADINTVLNTAVAEILSGFADALEKSGVENGEDFKNNLSRIIKDAIKDHKRIIFNGNNYSDEWTKESEKRGLSNLKTTVEALTKLIDEKNVKLFAKHNVFNETELRSRYEILLENYCKTINIEALTMVDMVKNSIIPSSISYQNEIADLINKKKSLEKYMNDGDSGFSAFSSSVEIKLLGMLTSITGAVFNKLEELENALLKIKSDSDESDALTLAKFYRNTIFGIMTELRVPVDELETVVAKKYWSFPTYAEILYSVN